MGVCLPDIDTELPDSCDCHVFYACEKGEPVRKGCPGGLAYNAVLMVCDWAAIAACT